MSIEHLDYELWREPAPDAPDDVQCEFKIEVAYRYIRPFYGGRWEPSEGPGAEIVAVSGDLTLDDLTDEDLEHIERACVKDATSN